MHIAHKTNTTNGHHSVLKCPIENARAVQTPRGRPHLTGGARTAIQQLERERLDQLDPFEENNQALAGIRNAIQR